MRGKSGNALDIVLSGCLLPKNIQIGDKLLFENMGDFHCVLRTANGNGETPPTMHSFINADRMLDYFEWPESQSGIFKKSDFKSNYLHSMLILCVTAQF